MQYTNLDPESPEGRQLLMTHFFSQSFPNLEPSLSIGKKTLDQKAEVLDLAFKVYHGRDDKVRKQKYQMLAQAI